MGLVLLLENILKELECKCWDNWWHLCKTEQIEEDDDDASGEDIIELVITLQNNQIEKQRE